MKKIVQKIQWHSKNYLFWLNFNRKKLLLLFFIWNLFILCILQYLYLQTKNINSCNVSSFVNFKRDAVMFDLMTDNINCLDALSTCEEKLKEIKENE